MTSEELNIELALLADQGDLGFPHLVGSGKAVPYYGWFWRFVDFDQRIVLAYADKTGHDVPPWVGFCQKNKWSYPTYRATLKQSAEIRRLCEAFADNPTKETSLAIFDYLQSLKPAKVKAHKKRGKMKKIDD